MPSAHLTNNYFTLLVPRDVPNFTVRCPECGFEATVINVEWDEVLNFPAHNHRQLDVLCDFAYWPMKLVRENRQTQLV